MSGRLLKYNILAKILLEKFLNKPFLSIKAIQLRLQVFIKMALRRIILVQPDFDNLNKASLYMKLKLTPLRLFSIHTSVI